MQQLLHPVQLRLDFPGERRVDTRQSEETARDSTAHLNAPHIDGRAIRPGAGVSRAFGMNIDRMPKLSDPVVSTKATQRGRPATRRRGARRPEHGRRAPLARL
ncbi:hypothetical protein GCM10027440_39460 [Nocardiopsis coralliicola]